MDSGNQYGTGMLEAMAALLLFSIMALVLMHYLQGLRHNQDALRQYQQALTFAHQGLERYRLEDEDVPLILPPGWRLENQEQARGPACRRVVAEARSPSGRIVKLSEWFCRKAAGGVSAESL
ncbi:prepilin-type N-terminal cleavage/methylation domain-containing protein [Acerihabitans sp. KWT182]|uniref:Prepilin-type N-terminal cleavage/methylation domain-containing protein n=1 Tax=Acerihabitans sp. KWT182 TaxID=3157919 RepID=A0AAU7Q7W7_9GAMM